MAVATLIPNTPQLPAPTVTRARFCGASVVGFDASVGWNDQASLVTVRLVEDVASGDRFVRPTPGAAAKFVIGNFSFEGIVQRAVKDQGFQGNPTYTVTLTDPREILDGARLILAAYKDPVAMPNLLNAFGFWESALGFGGSMSNESGMLWDAPFEVVQVAPGDQGIQIVAPKGNPMVGIRPAIEAMTRAAGPYGGPLQLQGHAYPVDLSGMPPTPQSYRVGGVAPTLLEVISQVCQDAGCDFMISLEAGVIKVRTVSRAVQPPLNAIAAYVATASDASAKSAGVELRNEVTNAVLLGGDVNELVQVVQDSGGTGIVPFWGFDANGVAIVGTGDPTTSAYTVSLDATEVADVVGGTAYPVTIPELRCALVDYESWAAYVLVNDPQKAATLGLASTVDATGDLAAIFPDGMIRRDFLAQDPAQLLPYGQMNDGDYWTRRGNRLYDFVRSYAQEYLGRKFLVRIPFLISWKVVPETLEVVSSDEPCDGGWAPENSQPLGLPYLDVDKFMTDDGRIGAFATFAVDSGMDLQSMDPADYAIAGNTLYLRGQVESGVIAYAGGQAYPYAVLTLSNAVRGIAADPLGGIDEVAAAFALDPTLLAPAASLRYGSFPVRISPAPYLPTGAAVPLKSNRVSYGPWGTFPGGGAAAGAAGKVYFERDETLVPWAFGDWATFTAVAEARLAGIATKMQVAEAGSVEEVGLPKISLGDALARGGPEVTGISCRVGVEGVTTSYTMQTFTPQFGAFAKSNAERLRRLGLAAQQERKALRAAFRRQQGRSQDLARAQYGFMENAAHAVAQRSPIDSIFAHMWRTGSYGYRTQVAFGTLDEFAANVRTDDPAKFAMTAGMTLEGIFRPYSTAASGDMPHFTEPLSRLANTTYSASTLHPLGGSDVDVVVQQPAYNGHLHRLKALPAATGYDSRWDMTDARGVGMRAPLVLVGFGGEYTGKPFPNGNAGAQASGLPVQEWADTFADWPSQHPEAWKAGPLDVAFDTWRGVWAARTVLKGTIDFGVAPGSGTPMLKVTAGSGETGDLVPVSTTDGSSTPGGMYTAQYFPLDDAWRVTSVTPTWLQVASTCGIDGGYQWQELRQLPTIQVTTPGSGYTFANASWSGGGGSGASLGPCIVGASGTPQQGQVLAVPVAYPGYDFSQMSPQATISIAGDGFGASGVVNGMAFTPVGDVVASGDLAYEARGCRSVPVDYFPPTTPGTPYLATRSPNGQLLFFCRPTMVARTAILSSYPAASSGFYCVQAEAIGGEEGEGLVPSTAVTNGHFFAFNLGNQVPPVGTSVVTSWVPNRWVFRYDYGGVSASGA